MKITLKDGSVFEGTAKEYAELVKLVEGQTESRDEYVPKVGDKVRALADSEFCDVREGDIGTVVDVDAGIDDNDEFRIEVKTDESYCFFRPQDLELVMEERSLVKGDYVVAMPTADERYITTNSEMQLGKVKGVRDGLINIEILAHSKRKGLVGEEFSVESKYFRKATDEEVAKVEEKEEEKPKQGDIVVITGNTNGSRNKVGDIGKVGETAYSTAEVNVPSRPYSPDVNGNNTLYEEMRLATEEEKEKYYAELHKSEFKAGDYARIKLGVKHDGYMGGGDIVKLYDNSGGYCDFKVIKLGNSEDDGYSFLNASSLEKVSEEELKFAKLGRKPGEFKKGDIARLNQDSGSDSEGTIVEITSDKAESYIGVDGDEYLGEVKWFELIAPVESRVDRVD